MESNKNAAQPTRQSSIQEFYDGWSEYKLGLRKSFTGKVRMSNALVDMAGSSNQPLSVDKASKLAKATETFIMKMNTFLQYASPKMKYTVQQCTSNIKHPPINENKYQTTGQQTEPNICHLMTILLNVESTMICAYSEATEQLNTYCPCCSVKVAQPHAPDCSLYVLEKYLYCTTQAPPEAAEAKASPNHGPSQRLYARGAKPPQTPFPHPVPPMNIPPMCIPPPFGVFGKTVLQQLQPQFIPMMEPPGYPNHPSEAYNGKSPTPNQEHRQLAMGEAAGHTANNGDGILGHSPNYPNTNRAMHAEMKGPLPQPGMLNAMFRSPYNYPMSFLEGQRRWSEAAAAEIGASNGDDGVARRWSMPYEGRAEAHGHLAYSLHPPPPPHHNLRRVRAPPHMHSAYERSRSVTPEWQMGANGTVPLASTADGLVDALQLLSHRPSSHTMHNPTPNNTTPSHSIHQGIAEVEYESLPYQVQWALGEPGAPVGSWIRNTPPPIPENGEPMREFTLFGADDTLSCLRNVTNK